VRKERKERRARKKIGDVMAGMEQDSGENKQKTRGNNSNTGKRQLLELLSL